MKIIDKNIILYIPYKILDIPFFYNLSQLIFSMDLPQVVKSYIEKYPHESTLEIGCGTGELTKVIDYKTYLGIDINDKYITYAKRKYKKNGIDFKLLDAKKIGNLEKIFDLVLMVNVIHHFSEKDLNYILKRLKNNVKFKRIIVIDSKPDIGPFNKILEKLDQGGSFREIKEMENIFNKYFSIKETTVFKRPYWLYKYPTIVAENK